MSMMNTNGIFTVQFLNLAKNRVKLKQITQRRNRIEISKIGQRNQSPREEIITIRVNQAPDVHALEVEGDDLEMVKVVQETIEDVLETIVIEIKT
jgi:hypothetical protein